MTSERGSRGRRIVAGCCAAGVTIALVALVTAQLALMSILDSSRAERAAEQIARSRFTADIIEQTVIRAVAPVAGADIAEHAATAASTDPDVLRVVEAALVDAHRQIVDPDAPADVLDGNAAVGTAIATSIRDTAAANGIDLAGFDPTAIDRNAELPEVVPTDLPRLGLRQAAQTVRAIALIAMILAALLAFFIHPRPGRSLRGLGVQTAIITGIWFIAMVVTGWVIDRFANTLFGEMIDVVWSDSVPAMLLLVGAGVVIGIALALGGMALDGYDRDRRRRAQLPGAS